MAHRSRTWALFLAPLLWLLAPAPALSIVMRHDVKEQEFLDLGARYPATVSLKRQERERGAEGTLVAPSWVLTAAHVAHSLRPGDVAVVAGHDHGIAAIVKHPDWGSDADMQADIALVRLSEPVSGVEPAALYTESDEEGQEIVFVGRGGQGTGLTGEDGQVRGATNKVEKAGETWLRFRFDAPGDPGVKRLEGISGPGDSGGPALLERDGHLFVIGVSSGQDAKEAGGKAGHYKVLEHYTRVSRFAPWLRSVIEGSSPEPSGRN